MDYIGRAGKEQGIVVNLLAEKCGELMTASERRGN